MSNRRDEPQADYDAHSDEDRNCQHRRATTELVEYNKPSWLEDSGLYADDDSEMLETLICPDCGMQELVEKGEPDYEPSED